MTVTDNILLRRYKNLRRHNFLIMFLSAPICLGVVFYTLGLGPCLVIFKVVHAPFTPNWQVIEQHYLSEFLWICVFGLLEIGLMALWIYAVFFEKNEDAVGQLRQGMKKRSRVLSFKVLVRQHRVEPFPFDKEPQMKFLVDRACQQTEIASKNLNTWIFHAGESASPIIKGTIHHADLVLAWPFIFLAEDNPELALSILAHELGHLRQRDGTFLLLFDRLADCSHELLLLAAVLNYLLNLLPDVCRVI